MADKEIIIDGITVMYGTSVKSSPEVTNSTTQTFDGAVNQGLKDVSWTIEISRVRYDNKFTHMKLSQLIEEMMETPKMVTVRETIRPLGEKPYVVKDNFFGCITDGNDYEIKPDDHTVENLKFKAERRVREWS